MNEERSETIPYEQSNFGETLLLLLMMLSDWNSKGEPSMWSRMVYLMPIAAIMSTVNVSEEIKMEGDLQSELERLLGEHMKALRLVRNEELNLTINSSYPKESNLWTIFDGILERYHLLVDIAANDGMVIIKLVEGSAWKPKS